LIKVKDEPFVIEYNCRMGDPETQVVMPRISSDFVSLLVATADGQLRDQQIKIDPKYAVTTCMVSGGYPGVYVKGKRILGLDELSSSLVFHAGTRENLDTIVTDGGRVLAITGVDKTLESARSASYEVVSKLRWDGVYFRNDIGLDLLNRMKN